MTRLILPDHITAARAQAQPELRVCRGRGCTDDRACPGGCAWVLLDVGSPTGVCSTCAELVHWHVVAMATMELEP